jgi:hypothetical protein
LARLLFAEWRVRVLGYRPWQVGLTEADEILLYQLEGVRRRCYLDDARRAKGMPVVVIASRE